MCRTSYVVTSMITAKMSAPIVAFDESREKFYKSLVKCLKKGDLAELETTYNACQGSDSEKKPPAEQAFRDLLKNIINEDSDTSKFITLVNLAATAVQKDVCGTSTLFVMLSDLFDSITLEKCDIVFKFVEDRISLWKTKSIYEAGKNYLLRMCNDLLRRLSKSQNTVFCGRIHLFLAKIFPLEEKSGLNLMSQFNLENITLFNQKAEEYDKARKLSFDDKTEAMDIEEGEMADTSSTIPIDYTLYRKFWSLQDFFRKPPLCYDKSSWSNFKTYSGDVLNCFSSFKLEEVKTSKRSGKAKSQQAHSYFAKYLTSEKLLDLQLSDCNFRRYVLLQFLILFQYLNAQVKFKSNTQVLTEEQAAWVKETTEKVFKMLEETPPDGPKFAETIKHIMAREENWNHWKNEGCPSYKRQRTEEDKKVLGKVKQQGRSKKRSLGEDLKASGGKLIKMGNPELTRLWNLCPDNMEACRLEKRNFLPKMEEFFEEAIEQMDPEAGIEDEYKWVNNTNFSWKSLRLLARNSPHFFAQQPSGNTQQTQATRKMPDYLEMMIGKLAKEKEKTSSEDRTEDGDRSETQNDEKADVEGGGSGNEEDDNLGGKGDEDDEGGSTQPSTPKPMLVTKQQLVELAPKLGARWKTLGTELRFEDDDLTYFESENSKIEQQALKMLTVWLDNEGEKATVGALTQALQEIGQQELASEVLGVGEDQA